MTVITGYGRALALVFSVGMVVMTGAVSHAAKPAGSSCPLPPSDLCTDYVTRGHRWATMPIPYYINLSGAPPGAEQDIQDAFLAWQNEVKPEAVESAYPGDRSAVSFIYMGPTSSDGGLDGKNVVYFRSSDRGTAGVSMRTKGKQILEFDIVFNSNKSWSTDLTCPAHGCGALDLQNAATHEVGHVLDLYHVTDEATALLTMYPSAAPDETLKRDLGAGDVLGIRSLYPE